MALIILIPQTLEIMSRIFKNSLKKTAKEEGILRENILCAGSSRGGMGALYHGLLGNYALVSMDPVVDRSPWLQSADVQLMFDCIPVSFVDKLNQLLEKNKFIS